MIEHTKTEVESKYTVENGYEHDAKVRYTLPSLLLKGCIFFSNATCFRVLFAHLGIECRLFIREIK